MHSGELKISADLTESPMLKEEMRDFGRKVSESRRVTYNARSGAHDNLILTICIALVMATKRRVSPGRVADLVPSLGKTSRISILSQLPSIRGVACRTSR
jgi:hypothetical protein